MFEVVQCQSCGLVFTSPQPQEWSRYYPASYYGSVEGNRFPRVVEILQNALYAWRVRAMERANKGGTRRVLDIGCGRGLLLKQFQKRGWEVQGTELDAKAAAFGRDVLGLPIRTGPLEEMAFQDEQFDAVVMWHVLEHVPDFQNILAEIARILKPGGVFLVAVPNFGSWEARLTKDAWFHLDVPRHLNHFTKPVLLKALVEAGLSAKQISFIAPEYDLFSFVQSVLSRIGIRHNLLYDFLRSRSAKLLRKDKPAMWQLAVTFVLGAFFSIAGLFTTTIAGLVGQGGTMTIIARKSPGAS